MLHRRKLPAIALIALILSAGYLYAKPKPKFVHGYALGHAYIYRQWTTVILNVENEGDESINLDAVLTVGEGQDEVNYRKHLYLPANCERSLWFYCQLGKEKAYEGKLMTKDGRVVSSGKEWSNVLSWTRLLVLSLDRDRMLPKLNLYLARRQSRSTSSELKLPGEKSSEGTKEEEGEEGQGPVFSPSFTSLPANVRRPATLGTRLRKFPDHWAGLDSMSAVALGDLDYAEWRPSQAQALDTWLLSGGVLLLFPGAQWESLRNSRISEWLPVNILGMRKQNKLHLEGDYGSWDVTLKGPETAAYPDGEPMYVNVLETELADGELLLSDGNRPMLVKKQVGMGAVYFFAFPGQALDQWEQRGAILSRILRRHERLKPFAQSGLLQKGPDMVDEVAGAEVAPPSFVIATLGSFFLVASISLLVAHLKKRTELAWAVIIPAGIGIGVASYFVGLSYHKKVGLSLNEIAVLSTSSGSPKAFRSGVLGVHTVDTLRGEMVAGDEGVLFTTIGEKKKAGGEVSTDFIDVAPTFRARNLKIEGGAMPRYVVDSVVDLGKGIATELQLGPEGVTGTITNHTPLDLRNCRFVVNSYPFEVGDLPREGSTPVTLSDANVGKRLLVAPRRDEIYRNLRGRRKEETEEAIDTNAMFGGRGMTRKSIVKHLFTPARRQHFTPWSERLFLLGWPPADKNFISERIEGIDEKPVERSISLVCSETPIRPAPAGQKVSISRAFCSPAIQLPHSKNTPFELSSFIGDTMQPDTKLIFYIPDFASNVEAESATIRFLAS
ncbi:MAG: hypothetical protein KGZ25_11890, partial [Planctomycetes bacterium]|nr:hypothetical protein [Planctomycetota bacterium]